MTRDEILSLTQADVLTESDINQGIEIFSRDAENKAEEVRAYSRFVSAVMNVSLSGSGFYHELHSVNQKYLINLEAQTKPDAECLSYIYIKEAEYFQNFNAYGECIRSLNKLFTIAEKEKIPTYFLVAAYNSAVGALWNCGLYKESERYMVKMEELVKDNNIPVSFRFMLLCNLMNGYAILGNREKSGYFKELASKCDPGEVGSNFYCFLDIFKLSDEARLDSGKMPSDEYISTLRERMREIGPGNGIEEDYSDVIVPIIKHVRGFMPDEELIGMCMKLIETTYSLTDKIALYRFVFEEFGVTVESAPKLYKDYYNALEDHYVMISDSRKHEMCNEILNEELARKYKVSAGTDALTGLGNRFSYDSVIAELGRLPEFPSDLYIVMMDLNGLKGVNDNYGHDAGDEFIRAAGRCISDAFGAGAKVFRVGGDEFITVLHTKPENINDMLKKLDENTAAWKGSYNNVLTISTGVSESRDVIGLEQETIPDRLARMGKIADRRMYEAKKEYYARTGINRRK